MAHHKESGAEDEQGPSEELGGGRGGEMGGVGVDWLWPRLWCSR